MSREVSIYLDFLRIISAFFVFIEHFGKYRFSGGLYECNFGHEAVIVFFLLSGYVVAFVAEVKENSFESFAQHRLARLLSVVVPVLLIIPILDYIGQQHNVLIYQGKIIHDYYILRFFANLLFFQELWFLAIQYFSDTPLWSLGYEFWYYALFATALFIKGKNRILALIILGFIIGPKILLLLPPWLLGVAIYRLHHTKKISSKYANILFIGSLTIIIFFDNQIYRTMDALTIELLGQSIYGYLRFSRHFLADYIIATLFAIHIFTFQYIDFSFIKENLFRFEPFIRFLANRTFSLYLFHFPLLLFFASYFNYSNKNIIDIISLATAALVSSLLLAEITECRKSFWKRAVVRIWRITAKKGVQ